MAVSETHRYGVRLVNLPLRRLFFRAPSRDQFIDDCQRDFEHLHGLLRAREGNQQIPFVLNHIRVIDVTPADEVEQPVIHEAIQTDRQRQRLLILRCRPSYQIIAPNEKRPRSDCPNQGRRTFRLS